MSSQPADRHVRRQHLLIGAGLFVATLLLFSRVLLPGYEFINYDDPDYVTANAHVRAGLSAAGMRWAMTAGVASNWHPLTWMSHMLDWSWFGSNPRGHHATSVVLHACNAVLAFAALRRLTGALWTSALFAALFAWHPLRVESVAWVSERKDVLSGFFWFATLWAYARYATARREDANGTRAAWGFYAVALVTFALGLMAKPMLVTLPCVLLLLDFWPLRRMEKVAARPAVWSVLGSLLLEKVPFFALAAVSSRVTYLVQKAGGSVTEALAFDARLANAVVSVVRYLWKFLVPFDLAVLYPHPGHWPTRQVGAAVVLVVMLSALAVWSYRRRPWITVGWLWFLGTLVPVIGIVQVGLQAMADRYTYLPMLGVALAVLWTVRDVMVSPGARRLAVSVGAVWLLALAARTWDQLGVWQNSFTLFDHAIAVTEKNYVAHDDRGQFLYGAGKVDEALADYRAALAINPTYLNSNNNLGHVLYEQGRPAEAVPFLRAALAADPNRLEVRNNLANALSDVGQLDEAMQHYEFVLARQPGHTNALNGSGAVLAMRGQLPEAKARLEKSLELAPDNASAHNNLGNICAMLHLRDDAIRHYRRAAELNPKEAHALVLAGMLLNEQGKFTEAIGVLQQAVAVNPNHTDAHAQLGLAYAQLGRRDDALREWRTALRQRPDHPQAKAWLQAAEAAPAK